MCYDVQYMTQRMIEYAERYGATQEDIDDILERLPPIDHDYFLHYHESGFAHPMIPVITNEDPNYIQFFRWGLIPVWVKDKKTAVDLSRRTLNARGETIFEKPSFRSAAKRKRCIVVLDGFYEHHHQGSKTYPYHITLKSCSIMSVAGLWEEWTDKETGEIIRSVTLVTTVGNNLLTKIHNNPKLKGPRMPVILPREIERDWLQDINSDTDKKAIQDLIGPYDDEDLNAHPVRQLRGKKGVGNVPEAVEEFEYEELELEIN